MAKPWQKQPGNALAFGASDGADADDYYDFLPSDDDDGLSGDEELSGDVAVTSSAPVAGQQGIATLASVPLTGRAADGGDAVAIAATATSSSSVLTSIGVLGAAGSGTSDASSKREVRPAQETLALVASGAVILVGGKQLRVSPESLAKHASRKSQLESALDAFAVSIGSSINSSNSASLADGEAPFRFRASTSTADVEMADAEAPAAAQPAVWSKEQHGEQMSSKSLKKMTSASTSKADKEEETSGGETDPLYDDRMDDADEKWVQRNFRTCPGASSYSLYHFIRVVVSLMAFVFGFCFAQVVKAARRPTPRSAAPAAS